MSTELGLSVATGAVWMVGLRWALRCVGIVNVAFLARLLSPADFGLVALAVTIVAFLELFGNVGVDVALIREQKADRDLYDSAWTLDILKGTVMAVVLSILAVPAAAFFAEPRVAPVLYALAAIQLFGSFQNIGTVEFRKGLKFNREFCFEFSSRIAGATLTVVWAYLLRNYWALVAGVGLQAVSRVVLSYALSNYRPRFCFRQIRKIFHFSKWVAVQNFSYGLREQAPVFAVSRLLSIESLGLFNTAKEISGLVTTELRAPVRRALYPGFARLSVKGGALKAGYLSAFSLLLLLSLPISTGLYAVADLVVVVLLGPLWLSAVPILKILALLGIVQSFGANTFLVLNRMGLPQINAISGLMYLIVFLPSLFWATMEYGVFGTAWAIVGSSSVLILAEYTIMRSVLGVRFHEMAAHIWRPILASGVMVVGVELVRSGIPHQRSDLFSALLLAGMAVFGAVLYALATWIFWWLSGAREGAEMHMMDLVGRFRHRRGLVGASS